MTASIFLPGQAAGQSFWSGDGQVLLGNGSNCAPITGLGVSLYVTQDLVASPTSASAIPGFSMELNGAPNQNPTQPDVWWLQWVIQVTNNQISPFVQYWYPHLHAP